MKTLYAIAAAASLAIMPAVADPADDARYIVERTITVDLMTPVMSAMSQSMALGLKGELLAGGIELSDAGATVMAKMMVAHMVEPMVNGMQDKTVDLYLREMSEEGLASFRAFLETPAGVEYLNALPALTRGGEQIGMEIGPQVATIALQSMVGDIQAGKWPAGTSDVVKQEIAAIYNR